jgi:hypothetical protein
MRRSSNIGKKHRQWRPRPRTRPPARPASRKIPGYSFGRPDVAKSPITLQDGSS